MVPLLEAQIGIDELTVIDEYLYTINSAPVPTDPTHMGLDLSTFKGAEPFTSAASTLSGSCRHRHSGVSINRFVSQPCCTGTSVNSPVATMRRQRLAIRASYKIPKFIYSRDF